MAILTVCVNKQRKRKDGCYSVYIRVAHNGKSVYIPTDKVVGSKGLSSSMEVIDPFVLKPLSSQIVTWLDTLNRHDISAWTARQVADFLKNQNEDLIFSDYARKHIDRLIDNGQERSAKNYKLALQHMERYFGTTNVKFAQLTSVNVNKWLATLSGTARAKEMYPVCIRQIFRAAIDELNDYDNGIIRVKTNPWGKVKIPAPDRLNKKAITAEACRAFFAAPLPQTRMIEPPPELGRDVAMMSLCLAGMNTIDIFNLRKEDYHGGIIHYKRAKTTKSRTDDAYIEMRVPEVIKPLFEKYRAGDHTDRLFRFCDRFSTSDSFCANVNNGIKQICASMGMEWAQAHQGAPVRVYMRHRDGRRVHVPVSQVARLAGEGWYAKARKDEPQLPSESGAASRGGRPVTDADRAYYAHQLADAMQDSRVRTRAGQRRVEGMTDYMRSGEALTGAAADDGMHMDPSDVQVKKRYLLPTGERTFDAADAERTSRAYRVETGRQREEARRLQHPEYEELLARRDTVWKEIRELQAKRGESIDKGSERQREGESAWDAFVRIAGGASARAHDAMHAHPSGKEAGISGKPGEERMKQLWAELLELDAAVRRMEQATKYKYNLDNLGGVLGTVENFGEGIIDALTDPDTLTMGMTRKSRESELNAAQGESASSRDEGQRRLMDSSVMSESAMRNAGTLRAMDVSGGGTRMMADPLMWLTAPVGGVAAQWIMILSIVLMGLCIVYYVIDWNCQTGGARIGSDISCRTLPRRKSESRRRRQGQNYGFRRGGGTQNPAMSRPQPTNIKRTAASN